MNRMILRTALVAGTLASAALTGCVTITNTLPVDRSAPMAAAPAAPAQQVATVAAHCTGACCAHGAAHAGMVPYGYDPRAYGTPVYQPTHGQGGGYYPPQAYPPQAYPPQAYPPQGYPYPPQAYPPQSYPPQYYPPQGYPVYGYPQVIYVPVDRDDDRAGTPVPSVIEGTTAMPRTSTGATVGIGSGGSRGTQATRRADPPTPVTPPKSTGTIGGGTVVVDRRVDAGATVGAGRRTDDAPTSDSRPVSRPDKVDTRVETVEATGRVVATPPIAPPVAQPQRARTEAGDVPLQRTPETKAKESVHTVEQPTKAAKRTETSTVVATPRPTASPKAEAPKAETPKAETPKAVKTRTDVVTTKLEEEAKVDAGKTEPVSRREEAAVEPSTVRTVDATKRSAD